MCTGEIRNASKILVGKPEGQRPHDRPNCNYECHSKKYNLTHNKNKTIYVIKISKAYESLSLLYSIYTIFKLMCTSKSESKNNKFSVCVADLQLTT